MPTLAHYNAGTQRLVTPEQTLARVAPYLDRLGITRCTSVTRLDTLGIPTYCAIRPDGLLLQVSNGKGLTDAAAMASATMEALELYHAEHPRPGRLRRTSLSELRAEGADVLAPAAIHGYRSNYFGDRFVCDWVEGEQLSNGRRVWVPASAVYFFCTPGLYDTSTNGLASGNHPAEATLHALYELIERDAMTRLVVDGQVQIRDTALVVDPATVADPTVWSLIEAIERADTHVVLLWLPSAIPLHTFWAVTLNRQPLAAVSTVNVGWGTHGDIRIAAARALTEAAQSRLVFIHGAREDILTKQVYHETQTQDSRAFAYFDALQPSVTWEALEQRETIGGDLDLDAQLARLIAALTRAGHERLVRVDLTDPEIGIPVVKVIAPSLGFREKLF
jgi:ribosomal protein S12 methylthiotransferase accessory factor